MGKSHSDESHKGTKSYYGDSKEREEESGKQVTGCFLAAIALSKAEPSGWQALFGSR